MLRSRRHVHSVPKDGRTDDDSFYPRSSYRLSLGRVNTAALNRLETCRPILNGRFHSTSLSLSLSLSLANSRQTAGRILIVQIEEFEALYKQFPLLLLLSITAVRSTAYSFPLREREMVFFFFFFFSLSYLVLYTAAASIDRRLMVHSIPFPLEPQPNWTSLANTEMLTLRYVTSPAV